MVEKVKLMNNWSVNPKVLFCNGNSAVDSQSDHDSVGQNGDDSS